ncbi:hypothetical protein [Streptomyces sp. NPDC016172]|uniref:hypothetical protein n=1 Tax=Streptomyces sp. NPDC016172 TaxID=3364964 RepID=UPI0036F69973
MPDGAAVLLSGWKAVCCTGSWESGDALSDLVGVLGSAAALLPGAGAVRWSCTSSDALVLLRPGAGSAGRLPGTGGIACGSGGAASEVVGTCA